MIKRIAQVINEANIVLNENGGSGQFNYRGKWRRKLPKVRGSYDWANVDKFIEHQKKVRIHHTANDWKPLRFQRLRRLARLGKLFSPVGLTMLAAELGVEYGPDLSPGPETIKPAGSPLGSGYGRMGW